MEKIKHLTIKELDKSDMPREKMIEQGKKQLSDSELLAILIGSGCVGVNALELSKEILSTVDNNLAELSKFTPRDLMRFAGIGQAKAVTLAAALELGRRLKFEQGNSYKIICDSSSLFTLMYDKLSDLTHEEFWAIYLNNRNKVMGLQRISSGGLTDTAVDIRILYKGALERNAVSVAVAHNHPSGNLTPSQQDNLLTQRIKEAGKTLSITLIDHIIIGILPNGKTDYFSYRDNGKL